MSICVCVCVCDSFCVFFLKCLITPVYQGRKSNQSTTKRFLREKLGKHISLRFSNFGSEIIKKSSAEMCEIVIRAPTTPLLLTFNIFQPFPAVFVKFLQFSIVLPVSTALICFHQFCIGATIRTRQEIQCLP